MLGSQGAKGLPVGWRTQLAWRITMAQRWINRPACQGDKGGLAGGRRSRGLLALALGLCCSGCANGPNELLRERCAQLANRGYSDRTELVALLGTNGLPVNGDDRALRQAAKQLCIAHL